MTKNFETDYLIVGSGAVGLAFADVLLSETKANILIVDKHHKPGGHWNDAYPFVTLHQPSAFYGVSSKELSTGNLASHGLNEGLADLATGAEILSYFDELMQNRFIPSGRVKYFPMCEFIGDGVFKSLVSNKTFNVKTNVATVDATYFKTSVPSTHTPNFSIHPKANFCTLNELPNIDEPFDHYTIIGGGKTGIDAVLWLLENQVDEDSISWIMPRDAWFIDRLNTQPMQSFFKYSMGAQADQMEALAKSESIDDLFDRLNQKGVLLRLDPKIKPTMFHGATISQQELEQLRRVKNVIRMGRVTDLNKDEIVFEKGKLVVAANTLHVDCSASAVPPHEIVPVFRNKLITIQTVRTVQPVFSAAFIAHIEATYSDDEMGKKNQLCNVVPLPNHATDWLRVTAGQMMNQFIWSQEPGIKEWLLSNRLDGFTEILQSADRDDPINAEIIARMKEHAPAAIGKAQQYIAELDAIRSKA